MKCCISLVNVNVKLYCLHSPIDNLPKSLRKEREEQASGFHQDMKEMYKRYNRKWNKNMEKGLR